MVPLAAWICGLIFGAGLSISGMTRPEKVLGFLDIFGAWDPSLAVVMAAALAVTGIGFALAKRLGRPALTASSQWPTTSRIDPPLIIGSMMFGLGWGLVGLCPGPAIENLATLSAPVLAFVAAMVAGMVLHDVWRRRGTVSARAPAPLPATGTDG
jgi:uncharacterized membrane protein YedE/YeeE